MAFIRSKPNVPPIKIDKFLGINENTDGEFNLRLGEATKMLNFRVTNGLQLKKREGYTSLIDVDDIGLIRGLWYGILPIGGHQLVIACNGKLFRYILATGVKTQIGTLTDAPTTFINFKDKLYIHNGYEYLVTDGATTEVVAGYIPMVFINTPPTGGGTPYEQLNVLTGKKRMTFSSDGVATSYLLAEQNIISIDYVKHNGVLKVMGTDYTFNLTLGSIIPTGTWSAGEGNIEVGWTKGTGQRSLIEKCRFSMDWSGKTDSRVFLWGNQEHKNRRFWSGLADGAPNAEYYEANSYKDEGSGEVAITDLVKMGETQKIFLENGVRFSIYESVTVDGVILADFPSYETSDEVGSVLFNQTQIVNNKLLSVYKGVYAWSNTNVINQTENNLVSQRVQNSLDELYLGGMVTTNWQKNKEYWLCNPNTGIVWVYNYLNDVWYKFDNIYASEFIEIEGELYFSSGKTLYKFDKDKRNDKDNVVINSVWEMGFYACEAEYLTKFMNYLLVSILPSTDTSIDVKIVTNNQGTSLPQRAYYNLMSFIHTDFEQFSFSTSYNPQPKRLNIQANSFVYIKIILNNAELNSAVTVLSVNIPVRYGGKI